MVLGCASRVLSKKLHGPRNATGIGATETAAGGQRLLMISLEELGRAGPNKLAALCQRVADNRAVYFSAAAEEAAKLKLEWGNLQTPLNLSYAIQTRIEEQKGRLRRRMIGFLAEVL